MMATSIEQGSDPRSSGLALVPANIWLLEDSPLDIEHTERVLAASTVRVFQDGPALLEALARGDLPDVLVLDWELAGLSGIDVCRFVRRTFDRIMLPIIMLTSHVDKEHIVEALSAGANDYVSKPFHSAELAERVNAAIRTRKLFLRLADTNAELERERARAKESESKYRRLADSGIIGIVETDLSGGLIEANDVFLALIGRNRAELASGKLRHAPECRPVDERAIRELLERGVTSQYEKELVRPDGAIVIARIAIARLEATENRCVGYVLDVTHERSVEADRARLFQGERQARSDAEFASRMKDEFLAVVSHELRTPMSAIVGWAGVLSRMPDLHPKAQKAVAVINRNARAQAKMIDDILDVSRIIAGKVRLEPKAVDLVNVVDQALEAARSAAEAKNIEIVNELGARSIPMVADADRLQQVIWNLLSNAVKFTPSGGTVRIAARDDSGNAVIEVSDSGTGIEPRNLLTIFERFRQVDPSTTRSHGGLGLGLAIVRHLVELHGGTVRATSEGLGRGAMFFVRIPLRTTATVAADDAAADSPEPPLAEPTEKLESLAGLRVVVVDDDDDARTLAATILRNAGAQVNECASADEALAAVEANQPDLLLTDIAMPRADGFSLLKSVRELGTDRGGETPAIALTAYAREEDAARALRAGFCHHIAKPFDVSMLLRAVTECVQVKAGPK